MKSRSRRDELEELKRHAGSAIAAALRDGATRADPFPLDYWKTVSELDHLTHALDHGAEVLQGGAAEEAWTHMICRAVMGYARFKHRALVAAAGGRKGAA